MNAAGLEWVHWGRIRWRDAMQRQDSRWQSVVDGSSAGVIYTLEHDPVITLGRRATSEDIRAGQALLAARGVEVERADRGGEATYHGPGQLVLYAVVDLGVVGIGVSDLVRGLAACVSDYLAELGIRAAYDPKHPGLWVNSAKIAAVGMRISRNVSRHGIALNLSTALDAFDLIVPCGMPGARTTSVADQLGAQRTPALDRAASDIAARCIKKLSGPSHS